MPPWVDAFVPPVIVAAGCVIQGSFGFGLGLVAAPTLVLLDPGYAPAPLLTNGLVLTVLMTLRERQAMDIRGIGVAVTGRVPGVIIGAFALTALSPRVMGIGFGVLILLGVAMSAVGPRLPPNRAVLATAGFVSGFMGTTTGVGGPPLALVYQHARSDRFRSTLAGYFVVGISISLVALAVAGRYGVTEVRLALGLLPGTVLGFLVSGGVVHRLPSRVIRPVVLVLSAGAAIAVILRQIP